MIVVWQVAIPLEKFTNRTYKNKKSKAINITDLGMINDTHKKMKGKPVDCCYQHE
ncbi:MAG: hypothetical protein U5K54_23770 [Cytophagales bacterium]|nr:hypothetical protein [Cytophagales bacterium]